MQHQPQSIMRIARRGLRPVRNTRPPANCIECPALHFFSQLCKIKSNQNPEWYWTKIDRSEATFRGDPSSPKFIKVQNFDPESRTIIFMTIILRWSRPEAKYYLLQLQIIYKIFNPALRISLRNNWPWDAIEKQKLRSNAFCEKNTWEAQKGVSFKVSDAVHGK